jgi:tetratricopeptide (TPR) repeat protein
LIQFDYFTQAAGLVNQGDWPQARKYIEIGLASTPQHAGLLMLKGLSLMLEKRLPDAETFLRRAIAADPNNAEFHNNYGVVLHRMEKLDKAKSEFQRAIELNPNYKEANKSLAFVSWVSGDYDMARASFSRAVALKPEDRTAIFNLSELLLGQGFFHDGWRLYQYRPNRPIKAKEFGLSDLIYPSAPLPRRLDGKLAVLMPEQGFGDVLFFMRYAHVLRARGARVGYAAERKIWRFIKDCDAIDEVFDERSVLPHLKSPYTFFAGDLPFMTAEDNSAFPSVRIPALPDRVEAARRRLSEIGPPPYVGVNWRAGNPPTVGDNLLYKQMEPRMLGQALRGIDATFVVLQRHPKAEEIDEFRDALGSPAPDLSAVQNDLEELMGYLAVIHEIVGVSSTSIHLRAAMGLDAKVLFVTPSEWRWMLEGEESPWFPGCRVYRVHRPTLRQASLERLHRELAESVRRHRAAG